MGQSPPGKQYVQLFKFPAFYGTRSFIVVFTRATHWPLSLLKLKYIPDLIGSPTYRKAEL
jgi:hypothetical protein